MDCRKRRAVIIQILVDKKSATLKELAELCNVSVKTIQRDIEILSPLFAIGADAGFGGCHYLINEPSEEVNKLTIQQVTVLYEICECVTEEQAAIIQSVIDKFWTYRL